MQLEWRSRSTGTRGTSALDELGSIELYTQSKCLGLDRDHLCVCGAVQHADESKILHFLLSNFA